MEISFNLKFILVGNAEEKYDGALANEMQSEYWFSEGKLILQGRFTDCSIYRTH